ncbi:MAG: bacillithiol biosynthesis cysteine-adding enzyme BshC [Gemmatimonadota bacterium]
MTLELRIDWPGGGRLASDYVAGSADACRFFEHPFQRASALEDRVTALEAWFDADRRATSARILMESNPEVRDRIQNCMKAGGFVVTTGQQPGLFTGPLFAVHKALTTMALARRWQERLGRPVLPVFWVASEDHDWDEANHAYLLDAAQRVRRLDAKPQSAPAGRPLFRVPLVGGEQIQGLLSELVPDNGFGADCFAQIRDAYPPGATLPDGFTDLLRTWLGPLGLLVVRADQPTLKEASLPLLRAELERAAVHEVALQERARAITAAGYDVQVHVLERGLNLFMEGPAGRERLYRDGAQLRLHGSETTVDQADVERRIEADPSVLSPNVLLRPVVESAVFPVLAYVAGPGEMAYWAQLQPLFADLGVPMPIVHPRLGVTVVEPKIRSLLDQTGVQIPDLAVAEHVLTTRLAREALPKAAQEALALLRGQIEGGSASLYDAVRDIDPTLEGPVSTARNQALRALEKAETKVLKAIKRSDQIRFDRIERARHHLMPLGKPQERVLNVLQYLARYGTEFLTELLEQCERALSVERVAGGSQAR